MKCMKRIVLGCAALAIVGCGGPPAGPDICTVNPIAYGCSLEKTEGAVANGFVQGGRLLHPAYNYLCDGQLNTFDTTASTTGFVSGTLSIWSTKFLPVAWANPLPTRVSLKAKSSFTDLAMTPAMDGPYHVLYNAGASVQYGLVSGSQPTGDPNLEPVIIPAYGIWIYAPGERPDYPQGAEVVTWDPDPSVPFHSGDGRCSSARVQGAFSL